MLGFQYRQTRDYDNFQLGHFRGEGRYEMPILLPGKMPPAGTDWISFNFVRGDKEPHKHAVHFYIDDYQFERIWDNPTAYLKKMQQYTAVCSPDFSTYNDFPRAQQVWNKFRNHWMGAFWQYYGVNVIQSVGWTDDPADDEWVFDGNAPNAPVAVSALGTQKSKQLKAIFARGYRAMIERLHPSAILFYGDVPPECEGERDIITQVPSFVNKWTGRPA